MWGNIFTVLVGVGALCAFQAYRGRELEDWPPGVAAGTPAGEWPASIRREAFKYQLGRNWKPWFAAGLVAALVGVVGTGYQIWNTSSVSRDDLIDALTDSNETYDRNEAACLVDFFDAAGIDFASVDQGEIAGEVGRALAGVDPAEIDRVDACLDDESRASIQVNAARLSDAEIRDFFFTFLTSEPDPFDAETANCWIDLLEDRGVIRDLVVFGAESTPELGEAWFEAEQMCGG